MPNDKQYQAKPDRPSEKPRTLEEMDARYVYTKLGRKAIVWDRVKNDFIDLSTLRQDYKPTRVNMPGVERRLSLGDAWLDHHMTKPTYLNGVIYAPEKLVSGKFNLWTGLAVEPLDANEATAMKKCPKTMKFVKDIVANGNDVVFEYVLNLMAWGVQNLDKKQPVALCMLGDEGAGKGTFAGIFEMIYGNHYAQISSPTALVGKFSSHLLSKSFLYVDEAYFAGDKKNYGRLKAIITEKMLDIEGKGVDIVFVETYHRILMATNEEHIADMHMNSRRFSPIKVSDKKLNNAAYFKTIKAELKNGGVEAFLAVLMKRDLRDFNVFEPLGGTEMTNQVLQSLKPAQEYLYHILSTGEFFDTPEGCKKFEFSKWKDGTFEITTGALYSDFLGWFLKTKQFGKPTSINSFGMYLSKSGLGNKRKAAHNSTMRMLPKLEKSRDLFIRNTVDANKSWNEVHDIQAEVIELRKSAEN